MNRKEAGRLGGLEAAKRKIKEKNIKNYNKNPKKCPNCQSIISYEKRRNNCCSQSCASSVRNVGVRRHGSVPSFCLNCGNKLNKSSKKYCSTKCQQNKQYKDYIERWLAGKEKGWINKKNIAVSTRIRKWLFETRGRKCEICKWCAVNPKTGEIPIQIDHIDGNAENCRPDNLKILCPNCHSLTPTFGGLNAGNGRTSRYLK